MFAGLRSRWQILLTYLIDLEYLEVGKCLEDLENVDLPIDVRHLFLVAS